MDIPKSFDVSPIGNVHSTLKERSGAPPQGWEGAPNATLEIHPAFVQGLDGIKAGQDIWILRGSMNRSALFSGAPARRCAEANDGGVCNSFSGPSQPNRTASRKGS